MKLRTKTKVGSAAATLAIAAALLIVPAQSASACTINATKTTTSASVSKDNDCISSIDKVQARLYRYYNSTINTFYGAEGTWSSTVSNSSGTNAGQAYRTKSSISKAWTPWIAYS